MAWIKCKICHRVTGENANFCPSCGVDLTNNGTVILDVDELKCEYCDSTLQNDAITCTNCGGPVEINETLITNAEPLPQTFEPNVYVTKPISTKSIEFVFIGVITFILFIIFVTIFSRLGTYAEDVSISADKYTLTNSGNFKTS